MTYSLINTERENHGSVDAAYVTVDITSLDSAGFEPFDPDAVAGLSDPSEYGVRVVGQESTAQLIRWDSLNSRISVVEVADGTDTTSGTDVGEVILELHGV